MKKMIFLTTAFVLFLVFVVPGILAVNLRMIPGNIQPGFNPDKRVVIYRQRDFSQNFISQKENLTAIGTSIRNPNLKNKKEILFSLFDENGSLVVTSSLSGMNLEDGAFVKFIFDPVYDSANKKYRFTISCPSAGPEETIELFVLDTLEESSGIIDYTYLEETKPGGIPMVIYNKPVSRWSTVKNVYSNWFSKLLSRN